MRVVTKSRSRVVVVYFYIKECYIFFFQDTSCVIRYGRFYFYFCLHYPLLVVVVFPTYVLYACMYVFTFIADDGVVVR